MSCIVFSSSSNFHSLSGGHGRWLLNSNPSCFFHNANYNLSLSLNASFDSFLYCTLSLSNCQTLTDFQQEVASYFNSPCFFHNTCCSLPSFLFSYLTSSFNCDYLGVPTISCIITYLLLISHIWLISLFTQFVLTSLIPTILLCTVLTTITTYRLWPCSSFQGDHL